MLCEVKKKSNHFLKLALVFMIIACVNVWLFQCYTEHVRALSFSRTVIKEELQSHSERSLQQTSNSSLKNPIKPAGRYIFPALENPNLHPLSSLCSWLDCKLGNFPLHTRIQPMYSPFPVQSKIHPCTFLYHEVYILLHDLSSAFREVLNYHFQLLTSQFQPLQQNKSRLKMHVKK